MRVCSRARARLSVAWLLRRAMVCGVASRGRIRARGGGLREARTRNLLVACTCAQGELLAKVPELQAANAKWRHEVHTVKEKMEQASTLHSRQMAECEQRAAAAIKSEREVLEREREQWKQYHQRHIEVEREERQRLEARAKMLEAQNAHLQEQNAQLEKACASVRGIPAP